MDSSEREPSYYEVALTNRQVMVAFVVLLACLFGAFFAGVWFGQGSGRTRSQPPALLAVDAETEGAKPVEKLTFFGESAKPADATKRSAAGAAPSAAPKGPPPPTAAETEADKLRRTLEAEMAAHREPSPATTAAAPAPGARIQRQPASEASSLTEAPTAQAAPSAKPASGAPTWIQVYSSTNGDRAQQLVDQLRKSGFSVRLLQSPKGVGTTYRVRVGPYAERADADRAAARLRREFRLDTWVTDQP